MLRRSCALFCAGAAPLLQQVQCNDAPPTVPIVDALVIGGGVVGVSVARDIAVRGDSVLLLSLTAWPQEKEDSLISGASSGNSGIGCTGYDAPAGSLERQLLRRSILRHPQLYRSFGLSYDHVNKCGAIVVGWSPQDRAALEETIKDNHLAGDTEAEMMSPGELYEAEPCLARHAIGAVDVPREVVVEPWLIPIAWAESARLHGAKIQLKQRVVQATAYTTASAKRVEASATEDAHWVVMTDSGAQYRGRVLLNCGGLYGDQLEEVAGREPWFQLEPRKVYTQRSTLPSADDSKLQQMMLELRRSNDKETLDMLRATGIARVPALEYATEVCTYSGLRPATEHRDYQVVVGPAAARAIHEGRWQIKGDKEHGWVTIAGIRSTGLTGASGIAEHAVKLYQEAHPSRKCEEFDVHSNPSPPYLPSAALVPTPVRRNATVPSLVELAAQYQKRGDGYVVVFEGQGPVKVTHPLTIAGMKSMDIAAATHLSDA